MGQFFRMTNPIQHYAWGSRSVLATMQGRTSPAPQPEAELWLGAHPSAPSTIDTGHGARSLAQIAPQLPYLVKILAIASPLSIQVHPSAEQARRGYEREERAGVPRDATTRNYKDPHAKPETVVALTSMWLLAGQQPVPVLRELARHLRLDWLGWAAQQPCALRAALSMSSDDAAAAVRASVASAARLRAGRCAALPEARDEFVALEPDAEALERAVYLIELLDHHYPGDPGLLVALCMNMVHLYPGQAVHTPAGQVHAYLSGTAVEIMGCSDNVLRAGLTPKHVDVPELLETMSETQAPVTVLDPDFSADGTVQYPLWEPELRLGAFQVHRRHELSRPVQEGSIMLVTEGAVSVGVAGSEDEFQEVTAGHSVWFSGCAATAVLRGDGLVFEVGAGVPADPRA